MKTAENYKKLTSMSIAALTKELDKTKLELHEHRFKQKFRNLKDTSKINKTKKYTAQIMTALSQKVTDEQKQD